LNGNCNENENDFNHGLKALWNLPESHVDIRSLGAAPEDAVELQRRELKHVDVRLRATFSSRKVMMPRVNLTTEIIRTLSGIGRGGLRGVKLPTVLKISTVFSYQRLQPNVFCIFTPRALRF